MKTGNTPVLSTKLSFFVQERKVKMIVPDKVLEHEPVDQEYPQVPLSTLYQKYTADRADKTGFSFNIRSPGKNALLSNDVWVKYTMSIDFNAGGGDANAIRDLLSNEGDVQNWRNKGLPKQSYSVGFKSGYIMQRGMQNLSGTINGTVINVRPMDYVAQMNRLFVADQDSQCEFGSSGGRFDSGNMSPYITIDDVSNSIVDAGIPDSINQRIAGNTFAANTTWSSGIGFCPGVKNGAINVIGTNSRVPLSEEFLNKGFTDRKHKLFKKIREAGAAANAGLLTQKAQAAGSTLLITLWERLPYPLFRQYESEGPSRIIPNIRTMIFDCGFTSNIDACLFQGKKAKDMKLGIVDDATFAVEIHCVWYTPPLGSVPQPMSNVGMRMIRTYSSPLSQVTPITITDTSANFGATESFSNIDLQGVPSLLLIYVKRYPGTESYLNNSDMNLEIRTLKITAENDSGKLLNAQTIQLYERWKRIVKKQCGGRADYDQYRKYHCVAALEPRDLGFRFGEGIQNPLQITVDLELTDWGNDPTVCSMNGVNDATWSHKYPWSWGNNVIPAAALAAPSADVYRLYVVQVYNHYSLALSDDGQSALKYNTIPSQLAIAPESTAAASNLSELAF